MSVSPNRDTPNDPYATLHAAFQWSVPPRFNMAQVCCTRWALAEAGVPEAEKKIAIKHHSTLGNGQNYTYTDLYEAAGRLSHALQGLGVQRGDRVAIVMPQRFETAVAYMAVLQLGERWKNTRYAYEADGGVRWACYLSLEFLMGRALGNAMLNLGVSEPVTGLPRHLGDSEAHVQMDRRAALRLPR